MLESPFRKDFKGVLAITEEAVAAYISSMGAEKARTEARGRDEIFSLVAHDLRNPLHMMSVAVGASLADPGNAELARNVLPRAARAAARMEGLIENWIEADLLRRQGRVVFRKERCDLRQAVLSVVSRLIPEDAERCEIVGDLQVLGSWDADGIERCIENLVSNALKYGDSESPITIVVSSCRGAASLSVHNHGNELSRSERDALFHWFSRLQARTSGRKAGWGLGLMLVKAVAEGHGGSVVVESEPGEGTTFTVRIPQGLDATQSAASGSSPARDAQIR